MNGCAAAKQSAQRCEDIGEGPSTLETFASLLASQLQAKFLLNAGARDARSVAFTALTFFTPNGYVFKA